MQGSPAPPSEQKVFLYYIFSITVLLILDMYFLFAPRLVQMGRLTFDFSPYSDIPLFGFPNIIFPEIAFQAF